MSDGPLTDASEASGDKNHNREERVEWMDQWRQPLLVDNNVFAQVGPAANPRPNGGLRETPGQGPSRENHHGGWPVKRFLNPELPGQFPVPPGARPGTGRTDVPAPILKPPGTDSEIARSAFINARGRSLLLAGGLTGAAANTGVWALDRYTGSIPPLERSGWVRYWRDNFSPSQLVVPERLQALETANNVLRERTSHFNIRLDVVAARDQWRRHTADFYRHQTPGTVLSEAERRFFQGRVNVVQDTSMFNRANIMSHAGTEAEVAARTKLFTQPEAQRLAVAADRYWNSVKSRDEALRCMRVAESSRDRAAAFVARAERGSITTPGNAALRGLGQGIGIAALTIGADLTLDRLMGNDAQLKPYSSWGLQGIGLPLLLMSKAGTPGKIAGSLAVVGASHLLDRQLGPPVGIFSAFARPSIPETVLVTASVLAPVRDWRVKTALVAGSWLAGRAYNLLNEKYEFEGKSPAKIQQEARLFTELDRQNRSEASFDEAVARTMRFARENEPAAALLVTDWQNSYASASLLERQRGRAALLAGLGAVRLEKGTRVDRNEYDRGDRALAGQNYDLGGEAANLLRAASASLDEARAFAVAFNGRSLNGRTIDDAEIAQYDRLKDKIKQQLDTIYGEHDIDGIFKELQARTRNQPGEMRLFMDGLKQFADTLNDNDARFKAKIIRDLALLHLSFGSTSAEPGTRRSHYTDASLYLERAEVLDAAAPDLNKIRQLLTR